MSQGETVDYYAKLILRKCNWNDQDESKKLEIMNTMLLCFNKLLEEA